SSAGSSGSGRAGSGSGLPWRAGWPDSSGPFTPSRKPSSTSPVGNANSPRGRKRMARIIEVVVSPTGETTVQTKGYAGPDGLPASRFLEQALGVPTADRPTAEYHQPAAAQQPVQQ